MDMPYAGPSDIPSDFQSDFNGAFRRESEKYLIGDYEYHQFLGGGGMGFVTHCRCADRGDVAVKVLRSEVKERERFEREIEIMKRCSHPYLIPILGNGKAFNENPYLVMPLLRGKSLASLLRERRVLSMIEVISIGMDLCEALQALHNLKIFHRDVKPNNVWMMRGTNRPILLDFGLAKWNSESAAWKSLAGVGLGTLGYSPIEQLGGEPVGPHSDLFSLGCILFECWMGKSAFSRKSWKEYLAELVNSEPVNFLIPDMARFQNDKLANGLGEIIGRLLQKKPEDRLQLSTDSIFEELQNLAGMAGAFGEAEWGSPPVLPPVVDQQITGLSTWMEQITSMLQEIQTNLPKRAVLDATTFQLQMESSVIEILRHPNTPEDYNKIFGGFAGGVFRAYCAPFMFEKAIEGTDARVEGGLEVHLERVQAIAAARYLFYEKAAFGRAKDFFAQLKRHPQSLEWAPIDLLYDGSRPPEEYRTGPRIAYFVGQRNGVPRCIFYFLSPTSQEPDAVLICDNNPELAEILSNHFDTKYQASGGIKTTEYWHSKTQTASV